MYIPRQNLMDDQAEAVAFMQKYSFATLITNINHVPVATHLPFVVQQDGQGTIHLLSHLARANPHAAHLADSTSLVIFAEPHAYISPQYYDKLLSVPTWNYLAVHAYGEAELITDRQQETELIENMISFYEEAYTQQWKTMPEDFKTKMLNGIVSFKIKVIDLQGKKKLSQNKTAVEQERIISGLQHSANTVENEIALYMKQEIENKGL